MFMSDPTLHAGPQKRDRLNAQNADRARLLPALTADEIVAEMRARNALPAALDRIAGQSSRPVGIGLFLMTLVSAGYMLAELL